MLLLYLTLGAFKGSLMRMSSNSIGYGNKVIVCMLWEHCITAKILRQQDVRKCNEFTSATSIKSATSVLTVTVCEGRVCANAINAQVQWM